MRTQQLDTARISRRLLLGLTAMLSVSRVRPTAATQIKPDDPRVRAERLAIPSQPKPLDCYVARPTTPSAGRLGCVLVLHDYWGPTPHFEDLARGFAAEGFLAILPDYGSRFGGTPSEEMPARETIGMVKWPDMLADSALALGWIKQHNADARIAAVGYGWGGSAAGELVTKLAEVDAAVIF